MEEAAYWLPSHNATVVEAIILGRDGRAHLCPPGWLRRSESYDEVRRAARPGAAREPSSHPRRPDRPERLRSVTVDELGSGVWWWTASHPDWTPEDLEGGAGWEQVVSSFALAAGGDLVLFDPLVDDWDALDRLVAVHGPPAIMITILWHVRSSQRVG